MGRRGFTKTGIKRMKQVVLKTIESGGGFSYAAQKLKIDRKTIIRWMEEDPKFERNVKESKISKLGMATDFANVGIIKKIKEGSWSAIKYMLDRDKDMSLVRPHTKSVPSEPAENPLIKIFENIKVTQEDHEEMFGKDDEK